MEASLIKANVASAPVLAEGGQFVSFVCGGTSYGIPIMSVREIRSWQNTTNIPGRSPAARGVLDIRGTVVEVFDLAVLLGGPPTQVSGGSVVLVLALDGRPIGVLVDSVSDIIQATTADLMPVPTAGRARPEVSAMVGHNERLIGILDLDAVFS